MLLRWMTLKPHANHYTKVVRTWSDDLLPDASLADAPIILGYSQPAGSNKALPDVCVITPPSVDTQGDLAQSIKNAKRKAKNYRMLGLAGTSQSDLKGTTARFFNDLESLEPTYRPTIFAVWVKDSVVQGIQISYANGEKKSHGFCNEKAECCWIELQSDKDTGTEVIFEIRLGLASIEVTPIPRTSTSPPVDPPAATTTLTETVISSIALVTSKYRVMDTATDKPKAFPKEKVEEPEKEQPPTPPTPPEDKDEKIVPNKTTVKGTYVIISRPDVGMWSIRGFFGFQKGLRENTRFLNLGVVYGKDKFVPRPKYSEVLPICKTYFNYAGAWEDPKDTSAAPKPLTQPAKRIREEISVIYGSLVQFAGRYIMGEMVATTTPGTNYFSHLRKIKVGWHLQSIQFGTTDGKLTGLKTTWINGEFDIQGSFPPKSETNRQWECVVHPNVLLRAKITKAKESVEKKDTWIQTIEFIRSEDANGGLPTWLLDMTTLRYIGNTGRSVPEEPIVIEKAPDHDGAVWSVRGFYGVVVTGGQIVGLGIIWGRD
jgi:hypothetical protein